MTGPRQALTLRSKGQRSNPDHNKCNQPLHLPGVGLHVDTTAHFSSSKHYSVVVWHSCNGVGRINEVTLR